MMSQEEMNGVKAQALLAKMVEYLQGRTHWTSRKGVLGLVSDCWAVLAEVERTVNEEELGS